MSISVTLGSFRQNSAPILCPVIARNRREPSRRELFLRVLTGLRQGASYPLRILPQPVAAMASASKLGARRQSGLLFLIQGPNPEQCRHLVPCSVQTLERNHHILSSRARYLPGDGTAGLVNHVISYPVSRFTHFCARLPKSRAHQPEMAGRYLGVVSGVEGTVRPDFSAVSYLPSHSSLYLNRGTLSMPLSPRWSPSAQRHLSQE